jgi:predicted glycosyltransferase
LNIVISRGEKVKKIMIYCQHLAGMGHLVRCKEIMCALIQDFKDDFKICFVSGGQIVPDFQLPPEVEVVYLSEIRQQGTELVPLDQAFLLEEIKEHRTQQLLNVFDRFQPDCLITECFPFSKLIMKYELIPLLQRAKASIRPVQIVCSLRDLIMTQPISENHRERRESKICQLVNQFYDAVLFHADARVQKLEDCFSSVDDLRCDVVYTGYVAQEYAEEPVLVAEDIVGLRDRTPIIVASAGGGRHGYPLLSTLIAASVQLADRIPHTIYVFAGPFMPEEDFLRLQQAAAGKPNVVLRRYTAALLNYLEKAELSVSLGGYNTMMNVLRTGVRSLLLPSLNASQTDEQRIRAEKFSKLGLVNLLKPDDLEPERLTKAIITALSRPQADHQISLQGAHNTGRYLKQLLSQQPATVNVS